MKDSNILISRAGRLYGFLVLTFILSLAWMPSARSQAVIYTKDNINELPSQVGSDTKMSEMKYRPKLLGSNYLDEEWRNADVLLHGDTVELQDIPVRLDVANDVLEILAGTEVKVMPSYRTREVRLKTGETFVSRSGLNLYGPTGFYRALYRGGTSLYCHYSAEVKEANYNVALDAGRQDDEIIVVSTYFAVQNGKLFRLEKKRAKILDQFGGGAALEAYVKSNSLDLKKEEGLIKLISHIDSKN